MRASRFDGYVAERDGKWLAIAALDGEEWTMECDTREEAEEEIANAARLAIGLFGKQEGSES